MQAWTPRFLLVFTILCFALTAVAQEAPEISIWDAAAKGDLGAVNAHFEVGTDINEPNKTGFTPLHLAAQRGHSSVVEALCENDADIEAISKAGQTALDLALDRYDLEVIDILLDFGAEPVVPEIGIHDAAASGDLLTVKLHVHAGTNIEEQNEHGFTPVFEAIYYKQLPVVEYLVFLDVDLWVEDFAGRTALDWSLIMDAEEIEILLNEHEAPSGVETSFFAAIQTGNLEAVHIHLDEGVDVNEPAYTSKTPLHYASHSKNPGIINLLIEKGAEVDAITDQDATPLSYAVVFGLLEQSNILLGNGADPNLQDLDGWASLHKAIYYDFLEIAELLVEQGADVNLPTNAMATPLFLAAYFGQVEMAQFLLEKGAEVNVMTIYFDTALDIALEPNIVELLEDAGALHGPGMSIHEAAGTGNLEVVALHLRLGTDINLPNDLGETPLDSAVNARKRTMVDYLKEQTRMTIAPKVGSGFTLDVTGPYGTVDRAPELVYKVETSTNLGQWSFVEELAMEDGTISFDVETVPGQPAFFFRVVVE